MKKALHPGAIAAIVTALVAVLAMLFVRFGSGDVKGVSMEEAMKITQGNTTNSFTGEPLTQTQKEAAARQDAQIAAMRGAGVNPQKSGTAPNFGARGD